MMDKPLVSVVCLCYNHERFVEEAVQSVLQQTYDHIQIIIVDDASTDNSQSVIKAIAAKHRNTELLLLEKNVGNCKAFNEGLRLVKGDFAIDFATDDVMLPSRIEKQVAHFNQLDDSFGVVFTDAVYIDEGGKELEGHYESLRRKGLIDEVPSGDVYAIVLSKYFISSPTMLVRTKVFREMNGYDEALTYEDFDFWVRSSRNYKYGFLDMQLTKVRKIRRSMSTGWYQQGDRQLHSTYLVCKKALDLNRSEEDRQALIKRVQFEIRQSVFSQNYWEADLFYDLLKEIDGLTLFYKLLHAINKLKLPLRYLRKWYHELRYH